VDIVDETEKKITPRPIGVTELMDDANAALDAEPKVWRGLADCLEDARDEIRAQHQRGAKSTCTSDFAAWAPAVQVEIRVSQSLCLGRGLRNHVRV